MAAACSGAAAGQGNGKPRAAVVPMKARPITAARAKENARNRARAVINKYAGVYAKNASQTKWILDLAMDIEKHYCGEVARERSRAEAAEEQARQLQTTVDLNMKQAHNRNDTLEERVWMAEQRALAAEAKWAQANAELVKIRESLGAAAAAAATGSAECLKLQLAFSELSQVEHEMFKTVNTKSYQAKERLQGARGVIKDQRYQLKAYASELERIHLETQQAVYETMRQAADAEETVGAYRKVTRGLEKQVASLSEKLDGVRSSQGKARRSSRLSQCGDGAARGAPALPAQKSRRQSAGGSVPKSRGPADSLPRQHGKQPKAAGAAAARGIDQHNWPIAAGGLNLDVNPSHYNPLHYYPPRGADVNIVDQARDGQAL